VVLKIFIINLLGKGSFAMVEYNDKGFIRKFREPDIPNDKDPKILTMNKPLIIESAFPGGVPANINPNIPIKTDDISREIIESVKRGAAAVNVWPRDPDDGLRRLDPEMLKQTLDPILTECPDVITLSHAWTAKPDEPINYKICTEQLLKLGNGHKYVQGGIVLIKGAIVYSDDEGKRRKIRTDVVEAIKEGVDVMEKNDIKPVFHIYDTNGIEFVANEIIARGFPTQKPYIICLHMGKHDSSFIGQDPWSHLQLITSMNTVKAAIPDSVIGLRAGGRNWLPVTTTAISMGIELVGVGMEDCLWMYPHKDEIIQKNSEVIRKIAAIAGELGRDVATPDQARDILKLKRN